MTDLSHTPEPASERQVSENQHCNAGGDDLAPIDACPGCGTIGERAGWTNDHEPHFNFPCGACSCVPERCPALAHPTTGAPNA